MGLFNDMLKSDESLFKNELALDYDFLPKLLPYRENEQRYVATCIKPLLLQKNGKNLFIFGAPGIGKTVAIRFVLRDLEGETDEVVPIYINCWQKNTSFKIILEMCDIIGYKFTHNKKTDELFKIIKQMLNKKSVVFAFDEIDKVEDFDFLYLILEEIYKKSVFLITNYKNWLDELDDRIKSRLLAEMLEFKPYNLNETKGILRERSKYAFVPGVWEDDAFELIVNHTAKLEDIRCGLHLMRQAGLEAENKSSKKIKLEHAKEVVGKLDEFTIKKSTDLTEDERFVLDIIKKNSGKKIGDLFKIYQSEGGNLVYKSFQRKVKKLTDNKFICVEKIEGGKEGKTSIVKCVDITKKLTDY